MLLVKHGYIASGAVTLKGLNINIFTELILTLKLPNFLDGIIHLTFFGTAHYHFRNIKMKT